MCELCEGVRCVGVAGGGGKEGVEEGEEGAVDGVESRGHGGSFLMEEVTEGREGVTLQLLQELFLQSREKEKEFITQK